MLSLHYVVKRNRIRTVSPLRRFTSRAAKVDHLLVLSISHFGLMKKAVEKIEESILIPFFRSVTNHKFQLQNEMTKQHFNRAEGGHLTTSPIGPTLRKKEPEKKLKNLESNRRKKN